MHNMRNTLPHLFENGVTLNDRLSKLHDRILQTMPLVDRIAVAIYDAPEDKLKTFTNSTREGDPINAYEFKLADSPSLSRLAASGESRVINEISKVIQPNSPHSEWLIAQGYRSSYTLPLFDNGAFLGFVFYDSMQPAAFTPIMQRDLELYSVLINMSISSELASVRSIILSAQVARDFMYLRDFETGAHLERMARYSRVIAKTIAPRHDLNDEFIEHLFLFAPLHDVGKIGTPDNILLKPGKLTPEERIVMQKHVAKGRDIVVKILGDFALRHSSDSKVMINIVACHHEMLDGSGYPQGLKDKDIPIEARIVTVADIFDALTSKRPYKRAWTFEQACEELHRMVHLGKLDADCVAALTANAQEVNRIYNAYQDKTNGDRPDAPY